LHLDIRYCGHSLARDITQQEMRLCASLSAAGTMTISVNDTLHHLNAVTSRYSNGTAAWCPLPEGVRT